MDDTDDIDDAPLSHTEVRHLRLLRVLVTVLTVTMILGFLTIVVLFVIRLGPGATPLALPDAIALPDGARATAFTQGTDWYAVVTDTDEILIYNRSDNSLRKRISLRGE